MKILLLFGLREKEILAAMQTNERELVDDIEKLIVRWYILS